MARSHHELPRARPLVLHSQMAVVLDACEVEVRHVSAVVDDPLRVGIGEADAIERRILERRLAIGEAAELEAHEPMLIRALMTSARRLGSRAWTVAPPRPVIVSAAKSALTIASSVASIAA